MQGRLWPVLVLVVAAALLAAGCLAKEAPAATTNHTPTGESNLRRDALPDGRNGTFNAFNETNKTETGSGGLDHRHDLWQGKERVTLFQGKSQFEYCCELTATQGALAHIRLPRSALVFEGTGVIEITLSDPARHMCSIVARSDNGRDICTDGTPGAPAPDPQGGPSGLHLWSRDASAVEYADAGVVVWGKAIVITIKDPKQTDMPHATSTLWDFQVRSPQQADETLTFNAKIDLVRAKGDIPLWPGHPDFYAASHTRVVLQKHLTVKEDGYNLDLGADLVPAPPFTPPEKLVSYGTRSLVVYVNVTRVTPATPAQTPTGWWLYYHNASGFFTSTALDAANASHVWTLKIDDAGMDSPYQPSSRWGFVVRADFSAGTGPAQYSCPNACSKYSADYDITVISADLAFPDEQYTKVGS